MENAPDERPASTTDRAGSPDAAPGAPSGVRTASRRRWTLLFGLTLLAAVVLVGPRLVNRLKASGIEAAAVQARLDAELPAGAPRRSAESILDSVGVHYAYDDFANRLEGTIPESRDTDWMGVGRVVHVVVELDDRGLVRVCTARDVFTFL